MIFFNVLKIEENFMVESWESEEALAGHKTEHYATYKSTYEQYCDDKYTEHLEILG